DLYAAFSSTDYTFCHEIRIDYANMLVAGLLPSRCTLYGMTLATAVFDLVSRALERDLEPRRDVIAAGLLAGCVPLVHAHSVVALALVLGTWSLAFLASEDRTVSWLRWLRFAV